jgi:ubiquinone/menaquinone biosynthesis C-methylase UbiE
MPKDRFSEQAKTYALYRPVYPEELFKYIVSFVKEKEIAWDCATGNGQSAVPLSGYFKKVFASDISQKQLQQATRKNNIEYLICPAEATSFPTNSFDLITVSQAYHWLNWQKFHDEAIRVGKPNCVVAIWMYDLISSPQQDLHQLIQHLYKNVAGPYWDAERRYVDDRYANVLFNFKPLPSKEFVIETRFTPEQLLGYFSTWSATQNFIKANGHSPIEQVKEDLYKIWPGSESRNFMFPVILKLGKIIK